MKKVLLTASALGFAMALTASVAAAEMSFSAKGKYNVTGIFSQAGNQMASEGASKGGDNWGGVDLYDEGSDNRSNTGGNAADAFYHHSFYLYPTLQVNDNITVNSQLRFIDRDVWGDGFGTKNDTMRVYQLWMDYASPIGKFSIGRMQGGTWGSKFLDSTRQRDGIKWATPFLSDPFSLTLLVEKRTEKDAFINKDGDDYTTADSDKDHYYIGIGHKGDMGKTDVALWHTRDASNDNLSSGDSAISTTEFWYNGVYTFGAINLTSEVHYVMGDADYNTDAQSLGLMIDANTQLDAFTVGGMVIWMQGDDNTNDGDNSGIVMSGGLGNDFNPLAIMTGDYMGLMNGDKGGVLLAYDADSMGNVAPGALVGAVYAGFQANDKLSFNGVLAIARANETQPNQDNMYGWELDLGFSYKLLDNLTYDGTFGYMKTGDFFAGEYTDVSLNNVFVLLHSLTMTF
jgi:hypothetical protein